MKKIIVLILSLVLVLTAVGCGKNNYADYVKAIKRTSDIKKGSFTMDVDAIIDFNLDNIMEEEKDRFKGMNTVQFSMNGKYDDDKEIIFSEMYTKIGEVGQDFNILFINRKAYIELLWASFHGKKYIELSNSMEESNEYRDNPLSKETMEIIKDKWIEMLSKDNVFKGEKVLVSTSEGEIKATEYTIKINHQQFKELAILIIDTLVENGDIENLLISNTSLTEDEKAEINKEDIDKIIETIKKSINETENLQLDYKAFIDIDGYIVEQNIIFTYLDNKENKKDIINHISIAFNGKTFNINKDQKIDFEVPTEENTIKTEDIDFQNLFNSK